MEMMAFKTRTIKQTAVISASPDEVYEAFMDAKKHSEFTGSKATGVAKVGGKFTSWDGYAFGKNLKLVKGKKIVQEWKTTEWPEGYPPSKLDISLKKKKDGTVLTMVHSLVPAEQADEYAQGWLDYYWEPLKKYFEKDRK